MEDEKKMENLKPVMNVYDKILEISKLHNMSVEIENYDHKDCMSYLIIYEYCNEKYSDSIIIYEDFESFDEKEILESIEKILSKIEKLK